MPSRNTAVQFGKFLTVGTLNTMIDFGTLNLLSWLTGIYGGVRLAPINVAGVLLALTNSYLLNKHWTFQAPAFCSSRGTPLLAVATHRCEPSACGQAGDGSRRATIAGRSCGPPAGGEPEAVEAAWRYTRQRRWTAVTAHRPSWCSRW